MFNVITRTNNRPKYFFLCHESIKKQCFVDNTITVNHYVTVDAPETHEYLKFYDDIKTIEVTKIPKKHGNEFPYNLYLNTAVTEVNDGWIIILDDDDKFYRNDSLKILKKYIENNDEDTMFIWRVKVGGRIVPSDINFDKKQIKRSDICNIGFMVHSKHKEKLSWTNIRAGDFKLIQSLNNELNTVWINDILTSTNNNAGNFGNQRDTQLCSEDEEKYEEKRNLRIENSINMLINDIQEDTDDKEVIKENFMSSDYIPSPDIIDENNEVIFHKNIVDDSTDGYDDLNEHLTENNKFITTKYELKEQNDEQPNSMVSSEDLKNISSFYELFKGNEKIYIMKESSIVMIAEMLSTAIESKKLYEDILNKKYLHHESNTNSLVAKNFEKKTNQTDPKALLEKLQEQENDKVNTVNNAVQNIMSSVNTVEPEDFVTAVYILYKNKEKEELEDYFEGCGIKKSIQRYIKAYDLTFNNIDIINVCKKAVDNNETRIIILHENSLVINEFMYELGIMCNNPDSEKYDVIVCGNSQTFGALIPKAKIQKRTKMTKLKMKKEVPAITVFDEKYYTSVYDDIKHLNLNTYEKAYQHWKSYGMEEQRYCSRSFYDIKTPKYNFEHFNGIILTNRVCQCISECFEPKLLGIILEKEFPNELAEYSPYLFENQEALKIRPVNTKLYKKQ